MLKNIKSRIASAARKITRNEEGASLAEYGLLVALIAVVCIAAITLLGNTLSTKFSDVSAAISGS